MVLNPEKLVRSFNLHPKTSKSLSASLENFRCKISDFLKETLFKVPIFISMEYFQICFHLISFSHKAFATLLIEIEYPTSQWGGKATHEYLNYSSIFLEKMNSISSSLCHINHGKVSVSHGLHQVEKNPSASAAKPLKKIKGNGNPNNPGKCVKTAECSLTDIGINPGSDHKERLVLEAVAMLKKIGFLALGFVLSGLCTSDMTKLYGEIEKFPGGLDGSFKKFVEMMSGIHGPMKELNEVNRVIERLSKGLCDEAVVEELRGKLMVLENCVHGLEKQVNDMFCEVMAARTKLLDSIRFMG